MATFAFELWLQTVGPHMVASVSLCSHGGICVFVLTWWHLHLCAHMVASVSLIVLIWWHVA